MPWKETCVMEERAKFIKVWREREESFAALCARFCISRKTGYKWVDRYEREGPSGLHARSRAPLHHPNAVSSGAEEAVLELRGRYPRWGADKLLAKLQRTQPELLLPSRSTVSRILKRRGLVRERKPRRHATPTTLTDSTQSNAVWSIDFKGQFPLGDGAICYPLTLCDHYSRYLLCCQGFPKIRALSVQVLLERIFRDFGIPHIIRSDNGSPFASTGLGGLTRLNISWIKLGIRPERIAPGHPEQNGRHERMHRDLKADTAMPPKANMNDQQYAFDLFRNIFNEERPHQALGQQYPAEVYTPSLRPYPLKLPDIVYPRTYRIRKVCEGGNLRWCGDTIFIGRALAHEPLGFNEQDDGLWNAYFGPVLLGQLDERGKDIKFNPNNRRHKPK